MHKSRRGINPMWLLFYRIELRRGIFGSENVLSDKTMPRAHAKQRHYRGLQKQYGTKKDFFQVNYNYTDEILDELDRAFSAERLSNSHSQAGGNRAEGWNLYLRNTALSESLYSPLQGLEILLRNALGDKIRGKYGEKWFDNPNFPLDYRQKQILEKSKSELNRRNIELTHGRMLAELNYGFWTGILGRRYETTLWRPLFHKAFPHAQKPLLRKHAHKKLDGLRILRNRIAHHEPISNRDLMNDYKIILELSAWISPIAAGWIDNHNRFRQVFSDT